MSSPIAPFYMDRLYLDLTSNTNSNLLESVHHSDFPKSNNGFINVNLQKKIRKAQIICSLVLSLRKKEKIKVRQPLSKIMIPYFNDQEKVELSEISGLIKSEVNVKKVELISNSSGILVKKVKPNFKTLGPKLGKALSQVTNKIKEFDNADIQKIENGESITIDVNSEKIILESTDLEVVSEDIEGWLVASENDITVALDVQLNPKLINEGICRELINRIQNLRKETGLLVTDKINLKIQKDNIIEKAIFENRDYILSETLAENLEFFDILSEGIEITFDNVKTKLFINKII
jgi:isoleucyl-tRNA synthetase